jgi:23S rRNA (guanine745-N1)-methyltransferase
MKVSMPFTYQCPVCKKELEREDRRFVCGQNHSFDISKGGYVNLLLANQKNSKEPGDSKFMAESRENFLGKGFYDPLADEVDGIISNEIKSARADTATILDIGCGVGFYCGRLKKALTEGCLGGRAEIHGIDISKPAIQKAAKKYPGIHFCVGSSFNLPYRDGSFNFVFSIFSPFEIAGLIRVLKPGGHILIVRPGENHLKELAELIYGKSEKQGNPAELLSTSGVSLVKESRLKYEITLDNNADIMNLVAMTPYYWHLNADNKAMLAVLRSLTVCADFQVLLFGKN